VSQPLLSLVCQDLDEDGAGVCDLTDEPLRPSRAPLAVHVAGVLPGERCTATLAHRSRHRPEAWADLALITATSPARVPPDCPAHGACGGCVLAHWAYDAQVAWKRAQVGRALRATPGLAADVLRPAIASPKPIGYRNKTKLVVGRDPSGVLLGAYRPRTHEVVDLAGCRIHEPAVAEATEILRELLRTSGVEPYDEISGRGDLRHLVVRGNEQGEVLVVAVARTRESLGARWLADALPPRLPRLRGLVLHVNAAKGNAIFDDESQDDVLFGDDHLPERVGSLTLRLSPRAFFQANRAIAEAAYARIAEAAAVVPGDRVVDAYCGIGGIGLTLGQRGAVVCGIEEHGGAVASATATARENGIADAAFVAGDVAAHLAAFGRAEIVVLNPPRKGCDRKVLAAAAATGARLIAYLSCRPATLMRDLALLAELGYVAETVTPLDMLPQTPHIEALALVRPRRLA